jgi:hypothetical protein
VTLSASWLGLIRGDPALPAQHPTLLYISFIFDPQSSILHFPSYSPPSLPSSILDLPSSISYWRKADGGGSKAIRHGANVGRVNRDGPEGVGWGMCDMGCESGVASKQIPSPASLPADLNGGGRVSLSASFLAEERLQMSIASVYDLRHGAIVKRVNRDGSSSKPGCHGL